MGSPSRSREVHRDDKKYSKRDRDNSRNRYKKGNSRSSSESSSNDGKTKRRSRSRDDRREDKRSRHDERDDHRSKGRSRKSRSRSKNKYRSSESEDGDRSRSRSKDRRRDREGDKKSRRRDENSRSRSRDNDRYKYKDRRRDSRSRSRDRGNDRQRDRNRNRRDRRSASFDTANATWGKNEGEKQKSEVSKEKPNFGLSGKLTEERNTYRGIVIKYSEPPEARKPKRRWRLYPFKGEKALQTLYIHRESAYLIGRERKVVDLPVDHPSCSKQHAVLQYRLVPFTREDGSTGKRVRPYLIDLESANGTFINNKKIEPKKYVELLERDVIKFGFSSREYVLLHENSKDEAMDDDVKQEEDEVKVTVKKEED